MMSLMEIIQAKHFTLANSVNLNYQVNTKNGTESGCNMAVANYDDLKKHVGHKIVCVDYGLTDWSGLGVTKEDFNVAIECETCNEVLLDYDNV